METGIVGLPAPPFENVRWINENSDERSPLNLAGPALRSMATTVADFIE